jgi:hypothetical protein
VGALATLGNFGPTSLEKKKDFGWWWYTWMGLGWHLKKIAAREVGKET